MTKKIEDCQNKAAQGSASAMDELGVIYEDLGELTKALEWYQQAAKQGHAAGQNNLGRMYRFGIGISKNDEEAFKWYQQAAKQGHAAAQCNLGLMYRFGIGIPENYKEALKCIQEAAKQGLARAQYMLGMMYYEGIGIPENYEEAFKCIQEAAKEGFAPAQYMLGIMYYKGKGIPENYGEALKQFQQAAMQGDIFVWYYLGKMYKKGRGIPEDKKERVAFFQGAVEKGDPIAQNYLSDLRLLQSILVVLQENNIRFKIKEQVACAKKGSNLSDEVKQRLERTQPFLELFEKVANREAKEADEQGTARLSGARFAQTLQELLADLSNLNAIKQVARDPLGMFQEVKVNESGPTRPKLPPEIALKVFQYATNLPKKFILDALNDPLTGENQDKSTSSNKRKAETVAAVSEDDRTSQEHHVKRQRQLIMPERFFTEKGGTSRTRLEHLLESRLSSPSSAVAP